MDRKRKERLQELYAAWGTTREEHMARMMELVDRLNAEVEKEEEAAASGATVSVAGPAKRQATAKKAAAKGKIVLATKAEIVDRLRNKVAEDKKSAVARIAAQRKSNSPDTIETEGLSVNAECLKEGSPLMMKAVAEPRSRLRGGKPKTTRSQRGRSSRGRRRR